MQNLTFMEITYPCTGCDKGFIRGSSRNPDDCYWDLCDLCNGRAFIVLHVQTDNTPAPKRIHVTDSTLHRTAACFILPSHHHLVTQANAEQLRNYLVNSYCDAHEEYDDPTGCERCKEAVAQRARDNDPYWEAR